MRKLAFAFLALLCSVTLAQAAPAFKWSNFQDNGFQGAGTSVNVGSTRQSAACGAIAAGDTLVAMLVVENEITDTVTPPAGWTQIGTNQNDGTSFMSFWFKIAGGSETCSYTFSWVNSNFMYWALVDYNGTHATTPIDASLTSTASTGAGTSIVASSITTSAAPDVLSLWITSVASSNAVTAPGDMTNRIASQQESATAITNISDKALAASGATGTETATGQTGKIFVYMMLALKAPAAGGAVNCSTAMMGAGRC